MTYKDIVIVFVLYKSNADDLSGDLDLNNITCECMHVDGDQADPKRALQDRHIIVSDVASRALEIDDITYIIKFDFPNNVKEYFYQIGRTGRAIKTSKLITYFTLKDWNHAICL